MEKLTLNGQQFTRLTVLSYAGIGKYSQSLWLCRCICGVEKVISGNNLKSSHTKSCGCLNRQRTSESNTTHGKSKTPEYHACIAAENRCTNPNNPRYERYGARGIKYLLPDLAEVIAHIGLRPSKKHSLDRIDNDGNYEIGNIEWTLNQNDNKSNNVNLTYREKTQNISAWSRELGIHRCTISDRLKSGWSVEKALGT